MNTILSSRSPQEKRRKSRSGCKACKARRIKCDETIPECQQCTRRRVKCPGYVTTLRWSYKHQKHADCVDNTSCLNLPSLRTIIESTPKDQTSTTIADVNAAATQRNIRSQRPSRFILPKIGFQTVGFDLADPKLPTDDPLCLSRFLHQGDERDAEFVDVDYIPHASALVDTQKSTFFDYWEASPTCDLVLCSTAFELKSYFERICSCLCAYDSSVNPIRTLPVSKVETCILYQHLLRYIIAAYLNTAQIDENTQQLLMEARMGTICYIEEAIHCISQGAPGGKKVTETLLALIMYGLASSWDGSNNTGIKYYQVALSLYCQATYLPRHILSFFQESLIYWWAGLSFATEVETGILVEPPGVSVDQRSYGINIRRPHPLTGVSPASYALLGKVGVLVHSQRRRALRPAFITLKALIEEQEAFQTAQLLEDQLLSLEIPSFSSILKADDAPTSVEDLRIIAEAFRLTGLLLLYRCFPDILEARLKIIQGQNPPSLWLRAFALYILEVLSQTRVTSGTRSVEQILLVIVAGELRKHCELPQSLFSGICLLSDLSDTSSSVVPVTAAEGFRNWFDLTPTLTIETPRTYGELNDEVIGEAREKLMQRVAAVRILLPYRSVERVENLIQELWYRSDNNQELFWVDVMIQKNWAFILA